LSEWRRVRAGMAHSPTESQDMEAARFHGRGQAMYSASYVNAC
jgi:hypothetical protein